MKKIIAYSFLITSFCFWYITGVTAQTPELLDNDFVHQINFTEAAQDFTIPTDVAYNRIEFYLDGGDGGKGSDCNVKGGKGAQIKTVFEISSFGSNVLKPGGTVRFIVGQKGNNRVGSTARGGGGGGGGTAILYKAPGATTDAVPSLQLGDANSDWVILAVAGAGGGAKQSKSDINICVDTKSGQGGRTGTSGGDGGNNTGGTNGSGGKSSGKSGAGGGYLTAGSDENGMSNSAEGAKGGVSGGSGGFYTNGAGNPVTDGRGGWGYGGGGAGLNSNSGGGGGGGGFSGGSGAVEGNPRGFGGGSFVNDADIDAFRSIQGNGKVSNPQSGYITYKFFNEEGLIVKCRDVTVQVEGSGPTTFLPFTADDGSYTTDGSTILGYFAFPITGGVASSFEFDCTDRGDHEFVLMVVPSEGAPQYCSFNLSVEDNTSPTAVCKNATVQLEATSTVILFPTSIDNGSIDGCSSSVSYSIDKQSFNCANSGNNIVELTVTDEDGNTATCTSTVTVEDIGLPQASCNFFPVNIQLDASGTQNIAVSQVLSLAADNCTVATQSLSKTSFDCSDIGTNTVTATVTDPSGNTSTCTGSVVVEDSGVPVALCQNATLALDDQGEASLQAHTVDGGSGAICSSSSLSVNPTDFDCSHIGSQAVTLTITNQNTSAQSTCTATVTIEDNTPPVALCKDVTINLGIVGFALRNRGAFNNGSYDNCGSVTILNNSIPLVFDCQDIGTRNINLTVSDGNLTSSCIATATIVDNAPPILSCQNDTIQLDDNGAASLLPANVLSFSNDPCGIESRTLSSSSFNCEDIGTNNVTVTVTDKNGNSTTCSASVTVEDNIFPVALCSDRTIDVQNGVFTGPGFPVLRNLIDDGSYDNCGDVSLSFVTESGSPIPVSNGLPLFPCDYIGTNTVILTATSGELSSTCSANLTVVDDLPPSVTCKNATIPLQETGSATLSQFQVVQTASDRCQISYTLSQNQFDCSDIGINSVIVTATDEAGNTSTCSASVTVENTPPEAVCQNLTLTLDESGMGSIEASSINGGSSDGCGDLSFDIPQEDFDCSDLGSNIIILTVTDLGGNSSTCSANITVLGLPCGLQSDQINCTESTQAGYDPATETYNLSAENCYDPNYYSSKDAQSVIQQGLCGDGEIIAHVAGIDGDAWAGIFMRENNDPDAKMLQLAIDNSALAQRQLRQSSGSLAFKHLFQNQGKHWLRLTRSGNQFGAFLSSDGLSWDLVLMTNIPMTNCIQTGLFVSNTTPESTATAWFDNVQIIPSFGGNALQEFNEQLAISNAQSSTINHHSSNNNDQQLMTNTQFSNHTVFQAYPNPTTGELNLDFHAFMDQPIQVQVFNQQGQLVLKKIYSSNHDFTERLHLQQLLDGLYLIQVSVKESSITKKISLVR